LFGENLVLKKTLSGEIHRLCRICRNADSQRRGQIKRREEDKLSPERRAALRLRRRKCQLKKIGWTLEVYKDTLKRQENKCAICKRDLELIMVKPGATTQAHADHEHVEPPKPRGILCGNCNLGIGNLQENIEILRAAIAYLEKYKGGLSISATFSTG